MTTQRTKHTNVENLTEDVLQAVAPSHQYGDPNPRAWRIHHFGAWNVRNRLNPYDSLIPTEAPNDNTCYSNAIVRLLLLPIGLPLSFWKSRKKKREMIEFVVAGTSELLVGTRKRRLGRQVGEYELV